jgi:hypothetical protein
LWREPARVRAAPPLFTDLFLDTKLYRGYGTALVDFRKGARAAFGVSNLGRSSQFPEQAPAFVPLQLHAEWEAISYGRRNFLLAGQPSAVDAMLASMLPHFLEPIRLFDPDIDGGLPLPDEGTLILMEIAHLTGSQQSELVAWLDEFNRSDAVQIVSTTSRQMVPLVESGEFRVELYYRLNVIRIDLAESATDHIG